MSYTIIYQVWLVRTTVRLHHGETPCLHVAVPSFSRQHFLLYSKRNWAMCRAWMKSTGINDVSSMAQASSIVKILADEYHQRKIPPPLKTSIPAVLFLSLELPFENTAQPGGGRVGCNLIRNKMMISCLIFKAPILCFQSVLSCWNMHRAWTGKVGGGITSSFLFEDYLSNLVLE